MGLVSVEPCVEECEGGEDRISRSPYRPRDLAPVSGGPDRPRRRSEELRRVLPPSSTSPRQGDRTDPRPIPRGRDRVSSLLGVVGLSPPAGTWGKTDSAVLLERPVEGSHPKSTSTTGWHRCEVCKRPSGPGGGVSPGEGPWSGSRWGSEISRSLSSRPEGSETPYGSSERRVRGPGTPPPWCGLRQIGLSGRSSSLHTPYSVPTLPLTNLLSPCLSIRPDTSWDFFPSKLTTFIIDSL